MNDSGPEIQGERLPLIAAGLTVGAAIVALVVNIVVWPFVAQELDRAALTWSDLLADTINNDAFWEVFWGTFSIYIQPWITARQLWITNSLIYLIPLAIVARYWLSVLRAQRHFRTALLPSSLPAIAGLTLLPLVALPVAKGIEELKQQGLMSFGMTATWAAVSATTLILGFGLSILSLAVMAITRPKNRTSAERG